MEATPDLTLFAYSASATDFTLSRQRKTYHTKCALRAIMVDGSLHLRRSAFGGRPNKFLFWCLRQRKCDRIWREAGHNHSMRIRTVEKSSTCEGDILHHDDFRRPHLQRKRNCTVATYARGADSLLSPLQCRNYLLSDALLPE